ncbi:N-methyl-L-tryptophan oxidase [Klebsiella pneumoniae]|nr:N-methyl-L-tryptophan oxidase [Klebsiella pneumoniae]
MAINITVSPAEDNELKIGKHNGGQPISTPQETGSVWRCRQRWFRILPVFA